MRKVLICAWMRFNNLVFLCFSPPLIAPSLYNKDPLIYFSFSLHIKINQVKCNYLSLTSLRPTDSVPADLKEPFYTDQYDQEHLKPPVTNLLLSADLYCRAGSLILKSDSAKPLLGHEDVIQALAQRGLYVTDQERRVTERDLRSRTLFLVRGGEGGKGSSVGRPAAIFVVIALTICISF